MAGAVSPPWVKQEAAIARSSNSPAARSRLRNHGMRGRETLGVFFLKANADIGIIQWQSIVVAGASSSKANAAGRGGGWPAARHALQLVAWAFFRVRI